MSEREKTETPGILGILDVALGVVSDLDLDAVLGRLVESARDLVGARYAALGVLDPHRRELERFITAGIDEQTRARIGPLPRGRGVLGELIVDPIPLRLANVGAHPHAYGLPPGHPPMTTFLGVPVLVDGLPSGNLYLTDKLGGEEFTEADEQALVRLAAFAGVAIAHARRYGGMEAQRAELRRTVAALDATVQIARAVGGETDLDVVLGLVAERGRALVSARALVIEREQAGEMIVAAAAGELPGEVVGQSVSLHNSLASVALRALTTLRLEEDDHLTRFEHHGLGRLGLHARTGLVVPLVFRGQPQGVLIAVDRLGGRPVFSGEDQRLLESFAVSAATAIATAASVEAERAGQRLAAAEQERRRWARELHDETLQNLAALRIGITGALRTRDRDHMEAILSETAAALQAEISGLRSLITDLRPIALDELGIAAAVDDLAERARRHGLDVEVEVDLGYERGRSPDRHVVELETAAYRIVQEALNNARTHGRARHVRVEIADDEHSLRATIADDGTGFEPEAATAGFGLRGMRERAELVGGRIEIVSAPGAGTEVRVVLPARRRSPAARPTRS